jgi:MFS family permease
LFTNIASVGAGFAMYGMSLVPIQILLAPEASGYGLGRTLIQAGLILMPGGLMMYLFSDVGARITRARGPRAALMTGVAIIAVGYLFLLVLREEWWQVAVAGAITSSGVGVAYAAMPALIMGAVPVTETAAANGLNALMRSVGTSLSAAVVGTVLAHETTHLGSAVLPSEHGFTLALLISLAASGLALALTLAIPARSQE